jgi:hypothetical protein
MILKPQKRNMHPKYIFKVLFLVGFLMSTSLNAQNQQKVDSLLRLVHHRNAQDTTKIKVYNDLGIQYASSNPKLAKIYINKALNIAITTDRQRGITV